MTRTRSVMNPAIAVAVLVSVFFGSVLTLAGAISDRRRVSEFQLTQVGSEAAVVALDIERPDLGGVRGSGVIVACEPLGEGWQLTILTCSHVARNATSIVVSRPTGDFIQGMPAQRVLGMASLVREKEEFIEEGPDVAVLSLLSFTREEVLPLADREPYFGDAVTGLGYPETDGNHLWAANGLWLAPYRTSVRFGPGASGGPVIRDGRVVALIRGWCGEQGHNLGWTVPLRFLKEIMQ